MSDVITVEYGEHRYEVPEPRGEKALALFNMAMGAMLQSGATNLLEGLDTLPEAEVTRRLRAMGVQLAGIAEGHMVARATLLGAALDGTVITVDNYATTYAVPGRYIEPHTVALMVWVAAGFFGVPGTSGSELPPETKDPDGRD